MSLYVHTGGKPGTGPAVVFVHGAGMDHTVWRYQTRWLAHRGWNVRAPDLPGHGASAGQVAGSIEEWGKWLVGFLQDLEHPTLVGHSMGGLISLEAARLRSLSRLVLVGTGPSMPVHPALLEAAVHDLPRAAEFISGWSLPASHMGAHSEPGLWERGAAERIISRGRPGVLAGDLEACAGYSAAETAGEIAVPTFVVAGSHDRMVPPAAARELAELIDGARYLEVPDAGHEPMLQRPHAFNRLLGEILDDDGKASSR